MQQDDAAVKKSRPRAPRPSAAAGVVRMNSSCDGKASYAANSDFQRVIASVTRKARQELAAALYRSRGRPASMAIADLGCATGPNALLMVSDAVDAVLRQADQTNNGPPPQLHVFLNDLPDNDFNAVFRLLPSSPLAGACCLVSAWPGSFYRRVFPEASLDYAVSSSSLHFLSRAPAVGISNRGRVYLCESGPAAVLDAYRAQFHADFLAFLCCRAAEVRPRGLLVLTFVARRTARPTAHDCYLWDLLADALMDMAAAGLVDEEQVHAFNAPYYGPCPDDLAKAIAKEGSFTVRTMQLFDTTRRCLRRIQQDDEEEWLAMETASTIRAVVEPMLRTHFGMLDMDGLFGRYKRLLEAYYSSTRNRDDLTNVFLVLEKKHRC